MTVTKAKSEVKKCIVVCANCHSEIHAQERLGKLLTPVEQIRSVNERQLSLWNQ